MSKYRKTLSVLQLLLLLSSSLHHSQVQVVAAKTLSREYLGIHLRLYPLLSITNHCSASIIYRKKLKKKLT